MLISIAWLPQVYNSPSLSTDHCPTSSQSMCLVTTKHVCRDQALLHAYQYCPAATDMKHIYRDQALAHANQHCLAATDINIPIFKKPQEQNCAALLAFVSLLWCTEALPLYITSTLIPLLAGLPSTPSQLSQHTAWTCRYIRSHTSLSRSTVDTFIALSAHCIGLSVYRRLGRVHHLHSHTSLSRSAFDSFIALSPHCIGLLAYCILPLSYLFCHTSSGRPLMSYLFYQTSYFSWQLWHFDFVIGQCCLSVVHLVLLMNHRQILHC